MNSKKRVRLALMSKGIPDRIPIKFDLCKSLIEHYSKRLGIDPSYSLSYCEDLSYRISANETRTRQGSDCVVGGTKFYLDEETDTLFAFQKQTPGHTADDLPNKSGCAEVVGLHIEYYGVQQ